VKRGGRYLSIASAGDNTLSILSQEPSYILAVDPNPAQIACLELRKAAFLHLPYDEVLQFLGVKKSANRLDVYQVIKNELSEETRILWDKNIKLISNGIIHSGKTERYFHLFRKFILPFLLNEKQQKELLQRKNRTERIEFFNSFVKSWRWHLFFNIFFSRTALLLMDLGRTRVFYDKIQLSISQYVAQRAEYVLTIIPTDSNPYLEFIFTGNFHNTLPFYLRKNNYERIRSNLGKLDIKKGTVSDVLSESKMSGFDGFNLSDIFEYMSIEEYQHCLETIIRKTTKNSRLVYWNNLVSRTSRNANLPMLNYDHELAERLFKQAMAFFYSALVIDKVT
jgi:S-adenosylmethionine-diacylglycerol 3-amino-3-carboxypropyl transferase